MAGTTEAIAAETIAAVAVTAEAIATKVAAAATAAVAITAETLAATIAAAATAEAVSTLIAAAKPFVRNGFGFHLFRMRVFVVMMVVVM